MPKYIVRPGQHVTHGTHESAQQHREKHAGLTGPIMNPLLLPAPPLEKYEEGDEIELTEAEAAEMPWAVCTQEEFESESSPTALMKKGYPRDEAESMVASRKAAVEARKAKRVGSPQPVVPNGMHPTAPKKPEEPKKSAKDEK